jgi:hypothetical protein
MESFDEKFEKYYRLLEEREEKIQSENDLDHRYFFPSTSEPYDYKADTTDLNKCIHEPMVQFNCPFPILANDTDFLFLENKKFANVLDIEKQIEKEVVRILSDEKPYNFSFVDDVQIIAIFRCRKCNCFDASVKKKNIFCGFTHNKFKHKDIDYYESRTIEKDVKLNAYFSNISLDANYKCVNCSAELVSEHQREKVRKLMRTSVETELRNIINPLFVIKCPNM